MKQNKNDTYFTITSNCIVRNVLLNKSELFICRTSEIEYAWGYLVRTVVLIAPLTGQQSHSLFFSTSPDWLQMPPLTSKTAFQPCCPGNQCWRGYWDGSQHALRACECVWAPSVTSCLGVKALLWGETHRHLINRSLTYIPPLKPAFPKILCINQCEATWSSHPKEGPMGGEHRGFTSNGNKWMWSHPK